MGMHYRPLNYHLVGEPPSSDLFAPFHPSAYLQEYYSYLGAENRELLAFLDQAYGHMFTDRASASMLEFGGGPTIYQLISAARYPVTIDFSEYLEENLIEVQQWLEDRPEQFAWDDFVEYVLRLEGVPSDGPAIEQRKHQIRSKVRRLLYCDAKCPEPLDYTDAVPYDIVSTNFVLESITMDMHEWYRLIDHIGPLVKPQGYLLMCAIMGATHYRVGELFFPAVPVTLELIEAALRQRNYAIIAVNTVTAEHREEQGYDGICMVLARKGTG